MCDDYIDPSWFWNCKYKNEDERKEEMLDVKETMEKAVIDTPVSSPSFIEGQKIDAGAAFQRLTITRRMLSDFKAAINATNTVDIAGEHKQLYSEVEATLKLIVLLEQQLIAQGE